MAKGKSGKGKFATFFSANRIFFFSLAILLASAPSILFIDLLNRTGFNGAKLALAILFVLLIANIAWGMTHALVGFTTRLFRWRKGIIESTIQDLDTDDLDLPSCVLALPVYNEDPKRVFAGVKAMYESLLETGHAETFDIFILSDSTDSENWVREEHAWASLCRDLNAFGRINYRRRSVNKDRKAGNLLEFCETWGQRYRYMITLDADSLMEGRDLVRLVALMDRNPQVGICQTAPRVVFGESLWGRLQQFANRFYGPVFMAGLNFWQQGDGNYWGHNAIIRMAPFMTYCALPDLPGREPFGGKILSHDFVEAALMRKAGFEVWLAGKLKGTYEEGPQNLLEHAARDRRWCQGNLQHVWLLFSRGLMPSSRAHLANGIMSYASSLLWLSFLVLGGIIMYNRMRSNLTLLPVRSFTNALEFTIQEHTTWLAVITLGMLFVPKVLALADAAMSSRRRRDFGGFHKIFAGVMTESLFSALVAPVFMLYHSRFVVATALGKGIAWKTQQRDAGEGIGLWSAFRAHMGIVCIGLSLIFIGQKIGFSYFWWLSPIWGGMILCPAVSMLLSKPSIGSALKRCGILSTPEELKPNNLLKSTLKDKANGEGESPIIDTSYSGFKNAIADPYMNAVRISMVEEGSGGEGNFPEELRDRILVEGVAVLNSNERKRVLGDPQALLYLYEKLWTMDPEWLHPSWNEVISRYSSALHRG